MPLGAGTVHGVGDLVHVRAKAVDLLRQAQDCFRLSRLRLEHVHGSQQHGAGKVGAGNAVLRG